MKKIIFILSLIGLSLSLILVTNNVSAGIDPGGGAPPPSYGGNQTGELGGSTWSTIFGTEEVGSYSEWIGLVWNWALILLVPSATLVLTVAGVIYMTSEGDSGRMGLAKKLIIGVVSGVAVLILGRLILMVVLGQEGVNQWWLR